jgi:hypothetical protein
MRTVGGSLSVSLLPRFLMYAGYEVAEALVYCCRPSATFLVCLHDYAFSCNRPKGGRKQERVDGKRNTEISVRSFNTHRVEYTGYPAVNGVNYCQTFRWQNFKFLKLFHDTKPTKRTFSFLRYLHYNITLNIATCFDSQGTFIRRPYQSNAA